MLLELVTITCIGGTCQRLFSRNMSKSHFCLGKLTLEARVSKAWGQMGHKQENHLGVLEQGRSYKVVVQSQHAKEVLSHSLRKLMDNFNKNSLFRKFFLTLKLTILK